MIGRPSLRSWENLPTHETRAHRGIKGATRKFRQSQSFTQHTPERGGYFYRAPAGVPIEAGQFAFGIMEAHRPLHLLDGLECFID